MRLKQRNIHPYNNVNVVGLRHGVFFFQIPNYSQKVHNGSKNASCFKAYEAIFVIVGIYTIWLFVICPIND